MSNAPKVKILRKISIGGVNGIRGGFKNVEEGKPFLAMSVIGLATGYKEKTSETMGVSYAFSGEFRAVNQHGEEFMGPVCYLPEPAQGLLKSALDDADRMGSVEFGFDFEVIYNETAIKGYEFSTTPKITPQASSGLAALAGRVNFAGQAALPAPQTDGAADADPKAPAKGKATK